MNFIQRAIKYVTRRMSKTILLVLTFFLIGNLVIIGLGVSEASKSAKTLTRQKMRAVITYTIDYDEINKYINSLEDEDEINEFYNSKYPRIRIDDVKELLKDERVKTANAIANQMVYSVDGDVDYVKLNNRAEENIGSSSQSCWLDENDNETCRAYVEPKFMIKANYFPDMIEFDDGEYEITDGRFYTAEDLDNNNNVVVVTEEFAEANGLKVGDTITISTGQKSDYMYMDGFDIGDYDFNLTLEVIGIYSHKLQITPDNSNFDYTYPYENPSNILLMPATSFNEHSRELNEKLQNYYASLGDDIYYGDYDAYIGDTTILLNDPLDVDQFVEDHKVSVKQFMKLDANNEEFNKLSKPLDTLSLYANFIVTLVIFNAVVIITLVTALTLKTREYEIGVLLSIGATKIKVVAQFFIELALVAIIGFTLAVGSGSLIANKVGQTVLEYQIASSDVEEEEDYYYSDYISVWDTDYSTDISLEDIVAEYSVNVSPIIIAEIYVVGLGIVLVSVIIPSIMIMRFNPKKILMNQG